MSIKEKWIEIVKTLNNILEERKHMNVNPNVTEKEISSEYKLYKHNRKTILNIISQIKETFLTEQVLNILPEYPTHIDYSSESDSAEESIISSHDSEFDELTEKLFDFIKALEPFTEIVPTNPWENGRIRVQ